jgi:glucose-6-phosphate 1-dehydrogenase
MLMGTEQDVTFVVVGASGDLARRKIYPALFSLFCQDLLPADTRIIGFARSELSNEAFRQRISGNLTCRYTPDASCADRMHGFLSRCAYVAGRYDSPDSFLDLYEKIKLERGGIPPTKTIFYLAIPPSIFLSVARALGASGMVRCGEESPWSRVVIEKPFGRDRASSDELSRGLAEVFTEPQTYRIDHYLGKEVIQNLMVLRFANLVFEPVWNRKHITRVWIDWREDLGLEGRAGYFDQYGIIRDVMQNHLLQILALVAMENPGDLGPRYVRDAKVRVLRSIPPLTMRDVVVGQYGHSTWRGQARKAYGEEDGVPAGSRTPTFAAAALQVDTPRWKGVPFIIRAGKGMNERESEVRIQFRDVEGNIFARGARSLPANELVVRIQPEEALYLSVINKRPGLVPVLDRTNLDLQYHSAFSGQQIPDAYECLLLDVLEGDKSLFIRDDELAAAWDIFTPVLTALEEQGVVPESYPFGSMGPPVDHLLDRGQFA